MEQVTVLGGRSCRVARRHGSLRNGAFLFDLIRNEARKSNPRLIIRDTHGGTGLLQFSLRSLTG